MLARAQTAETIRDELGESPSEKAFFIKSKLIVITSPKKRKDPDWHLGPYEMKGGNLLWEDQEPLYGAPY